MKAIIIIICCLLASPAMARHRHHVAAVAPSITCNNDGRCVSMAPSAPRASRSPRSTWRVADGNGNRVTGRDPRPRAWCGWWMRQYLGVADRAGNLARWWARFGRHAGGPAVGTLVVWSHHVGIITGRTEAGWLIKSGNDGHAVRERVRSVRGAIAFRWPA